MTLRLLATGGTIASRKDDTGAVVPAVAPGELITLAPGLGDVDALEVEEIDRVNGWNVTPDTMVTVARRARAALEDDGVAGVVVTHGTDTIEETAYLTDLLAGDVTERGAIVFACAMRFASDVSADGPRNLLQAARVAVDPAARGRGVLLCVNDELHAARWATKTDTTNISTFRSPPAGPVGTVEGGRARFDLPSPPRPPAGERIEPDVALVKVYTGMDDALLRFLLDRGVRGLVLEGTGAGHVPGSIMGAIEDAVGAGVPVVVASRCWTGRVVPIYGGPGGGITLDRLGVIQSNGLNAAKARLALMVALGLTSDLGRLRTWFAGA